MTQKYIRKWAGFGWVRRSYYHLHEPPIVSAIYGIWYLIVMTIGVYSTLNPPRTIEAAAGDYLMSAIAGLLAVAGALGVITVATGDAWLERFAVGFGLLGWGGYWFISLSLWITATTGNRGMATLGIFGSLILTGGRWFWIRNISFSDRKKRRLQRRRHRRRLPQR